MLTRAAPASSNGFRGRLARRLSPDPAGLAAVNPADPQSWNRYSYVENVPLALTDPLGLCSPTGVCVPSCGGPCCYTCGVPNPAPYTFSVTTIDGRDQSIGSGLGVGAPDNIASAGLIFGRTPSVDTGGNGNGPAAPQAPAHDPVAARLACAANWAQNHSLAALFGVQNTTLGRAVAGNSVAGLVDLGLAVAGQGPLNSPARVAAQVYGGGLGAGIPGAWSGAVGGRFFGPGAGGLARNAVTSAYVNVVTGSGEELITGITGAAADAASGASTLGEAAVPFVGWGKFILDFGAFVAGAVACR